MNGETSTQPHELVTVKWQCVAMATSGKHQGVSASKVYTDTMNSSLWSRPGDFMYQSSTLPWLRHGGSRSIGACMLVLYKSLSVLISTIISLSMRLASTDGFEFY